MDSLEQRIRERAYQIWEEEGHPQGRDSEHWQRARSEIMAGQNREQVLHEKAPSEAGRTSRSPKVEPKSKRSSRSTKKPSEDRPRL